ncbi:MAG: DUF87 domain-containing protein [Chloroflexi bacterium]|nr:DUF87 domain-containing protein [Chloroflexota bacterium]
MREYGDEYDDLRDDDEYLDEYDDPDEEIDEDDEDEESAPSTSRANPFTKPGSTSGLPGPSRPGSFGSGSSASRLPGSVGPNRPGGSPSGGTPGSGTGSPSGARPFGSGTPGSGQGSPSGARPFGSGSSAPGGGQGSPSGARPFGSGTSGSGQGSPSGARPFGSGSPSGSPSGGSGNPPGTRPFGSGSPTSSTPGSGQGSPSGARPFGSGSSAPGGSTPGRRDEPKKEDKPGGGLGGRLGGLPGGLGSRLGGDKPDNKPASKPADSGKGGIGGLFNRNKDAASNKPATPKNKTGGGLGGALGGLTSRFGGGKKDDKKPGMATGASSFGRSSAPPSSATPGAKPGSSTFGKPFGASGGTSSIGGARPGAAPGRPAEKKGLFSFLQRGKKDDKKAAKPRQSKAPKVETGQGLTLDNKLDILGVALVLGSLVLFFSSISVTKGALTERINLALANLFGWGAIAIPLAMLAAGVWLIARHFGDEAPVIDRTRLIGVVVLYLGLLIFLQFVESFSYAGVTNLAQLRVQLELSSAFGRGGGGIGAQLYYLLVANVSEIGAFFVTVGWLLVGVMLTANLSFYQLAVFLISAGRSFRDARARRAQARAAEQAAKALAAQQTAPGITVTTPPPEQLPMPQTQALPAASQTAAPALPEPPRPARDIPITIGGRTITSAFNSGELVPAETAPAAPATGSSVPARPDEGGRGGLGSRLRGAVPSFSLPGSKPADASKPVNDKPAKSDDKPDTAKPAAPGVRERLFGAKPATASAPTAETPKPAVTSPVAGGKPESVPATAPTTETPASTPGGNRWMRPGGQPPTTAPETAKAVEEPAARLGDLMKPAAKTPETKSGEEPAARLGDLVRPSSAPPAKKQTGSFPVAKPADSPAKPAESHPFGAPPRAEPAAKPAAQPFDDDIVDDDDDQMTESEELRSLPPARPKGFIEPPPKPEEHKTRFGVSVFGAPRPGATPPGKPEPADDKPPLTDRMNRLNAIRSGSLAPEKDGDKADVPVRKPSGEEKAGGDQAGTTITPAAATVKPEDDKPAAPVRPFGAKPDDKPVAPFGPPRSGGDGTKTTTQEPAKPAARPEDAAPRPFGSTPFSQPPAAAPSGKAGDGERPKEAAKPTEDSRPKSTSPAAPAAAAQTTPQPGPERRSVFTPPSTPPVAPQRATPVINPGAQSVPQAAQPAPLPTISSTKRRREWKLPDASTLLRPGSEQDFDREQLLARARTIEDTLSSFGAPGKVVEVNTGPVITQFAVEPDYLMSRGGKKSRVKVSAIAQLDKDLQLALGAKSIRIEAPVPGKGYVGIEVPNEQPALVSLRDVMESEEFNRIKSPLTIALGQSVDGTPVAADLGNMPHLLIAGTTGSGKSVCVNAIIASLLLRNPPDRLKFIMVDPKRVELTGYNGIPHLVAPVVVELERIVGVLKWVTREMDERYKRFSNAGARNIEDFNKHLAPNDEWMPYIVVIIDELADLMMLAPDETERVITRIAALARATGIHLVIATQRPSVDVVTGLIKANFPARIAFAVASSVDSRVIIDQPGADRLLGRGDMLYMSGDSPAPLRLQGVFVSDTEIANINRYWKSQVAEDEVAAKPITQLVLDHTIAEPPRPVMPSNERQQIQQAFWDEEERASSRGGFMGLGSDNDDDDAPDDGEDELYDEAVEMVRRLNKASVSLLQRRLRIGYTRAARLIDLMEERGVVGPAESGSKPREVLPVKG